MTKIYDIVQVEEYLYMIDKEARAKLGWNVNLAIDKIQNLSRDYEKFTTEWQFCRMILASNNPSLSDLPKLPEVKNYKDSVEDHRNLLKLAKADFDSTKTEFANQAFEILACIDWVRGYNANPNKYTEEDIKIAFGLGAANNQNGYPSFDEVIKSLNQSKVPKQVEVEVAPSLPQMNIFEFPIPDKNNFVKVKQWIYES